MIGDAANLASWFCAVSGGHASGWASYRVPSRRRKPTTAGQVMPPVRSGSLKLIISRGIRTATRCRAAPSVTVAMSLIEEVRFASDSPLEGSAFEL